MERFGGDEVFMRPQEWMLFWRLFRKARNAGGNKYPYNTPMSA